jgi:hypothetical protein
MKKILRKFTIIGPYVEIGHLGDEAVKKAPFMVV